MELIDHDDGDAKLRRWFCGTINGSVVLPQSQSMRELILEDICFINFSCASFHIFFLLILVITRGIAYIQTTHTRRFLVKSSGHNIRWMLSILLLVILLITFAEGILTDRTSSGDEKTSFLYLYVPHICALCTTLCAISLSHYMEAWQKRRPAIILMYYWIFSCACEILRLINLNKLHLADANVVRFDTTVILLLIYTALAVEAHRFRSQDLNDLHMPVNREKDENNSSMHFIQSYASFPSRVLHWWMSRLFKLGSRKPLTFEDLGTLPEENLVAHNYQKLKQAMLKEIKGATESGSRPSLFRVIFSCSWRVILSYGVLRACSEPLALVTPFALSGIISYVETLETEPQQKGDFHYVTLKEFIADGFILLTVIFVCNVTERLCLWTSQYMLVEESVRIRTALQAAVYERSIQLSSLADPKSQTNMGQITNYMSTDAANVLQAIQMIHFVIIPPLTLAALLMLFNTLGISAGCGMVVFVVLFPVVIMTSKTSSVIQKRALHHSDERVKHTHELLKEIKLVKMSSWEELFCSGIEKLRRKEVRQIGFKNLLFAVTAFSSNATPILMTLVSFGTYTFLTGKPLTPKVAFPSLALFALFDRFLYVVPTGLSLTITGYVSTKRLQSFLFTADAVQMLAGKDSEVTPAVSSEHYKDTEMTTQYANGGHDFEPTKNGYIELKPLTNEKYQNPEQKLVDSSVENVDNSIMVQISDCSFAWKNAESEPVLRNINIEFKTGELTMIVGPVGSGKSALLASILGELVLIKGKVTFPYNSKPTMAFAAQRPWIQNATLRDNILCGLTLDAPRYNAVISACALGPDIELLPDGDLTEIGERGINLSGGQKQRVNVARAIYSKAQLILLDDPLSALDVHVGSQVFESGIMGLLRRNNRTVILVTNQLQYLKYADKVVVVKNPGEVYHQGSYSSLIEKDKSFLKQWSKVVGRDRSQAELQTLEHERAVLQQQIAQREQYNSQKEQDIHKGERNVLVKKEEIARGSVVMSVYWYLMKACGWSIWAYIIGFGIVNALYLGKDFWLADWSEEGEENPNEAKANLAYYIVGYAVLALSTVLVSLVAQFLHTLAAYTCSNTLHTAMLENVSKLHFRFFDTNPLGRILNRFSNDMNCIDMLLFRATDGSLYTVWRMIFCLIAITTVAPVFIVVTAVIGMLYFFIQRYYLQTSRELQRIENVCKSPVYAHFSETLDGLSTIRAYGFQKQFLDTLFQRIDNYSTAYLYRKTANFWLSLRLEFLGTCTVLLAGLSTLLGVVTSSLSPAYVGLAIIYAQRASTGFNHLIRWLSSMEINMNAVERVKQYALQPTEQYEGIRQPLPDDWPQKGAIKFKDVTIKYDNDLDPVVYHIDLHFHAQEKIGICGRTGSGKSSLALALFRCNVISTGCIHIDDVDILEVPLRTLRQQLAIIPQDPSLFIGTIRKNLDPQGTKTDDELWDALDIVQLKSTVAELEGGLDATVSEGGENFSVGQRQLFCLARTYLHKSRILIMDEATASVDTETSKILHETLTSAFVDRTVLIIVHRVSSILECDRIVVMKEGRVVEFDTPRNLLSEQNSIFRSIVQASEDGVLSQFRD